MTFKSSSACYWSKRLGKRVPNSRSRDTERSLPELSPGTMKSVVSAERSLLRDRSRLTGSVTSLTYAGDLLLCAMCITAGPVQAIESSPVRDRRCTTELHRQQ